MRSSLAVVSCLVFCLVLPSCSNPRKTIVGKWEAVKPAEDGGKFTYEFSADGAVTVRDGKKGSYKFLDDEHIDVISAPVAMGRLSATTTFHFRVKISGDTLYLGEGIQRDSDFGESHKYTRVKSE